jgi:hypothetical protein
MVSRRHIITLNDKQVLLALTGRPQGLARRQMAKVLLVKDSAQKFKRNLEKLRIIGYVKKIRVTFPNIETKWVLTEKGKDYVDANILRQKT